MGREPSQDVGTGTSPVLVGAGVVTQRGVATDGLDAAGLDALEDTLGLMAAAARAAADDGAGGAAGAEALLAAVDWIGVPEGMWATPDPGRLVAERIGAPGARTCWAAVGVLQQDLIARACSLVASGEIEVALVVGGEARHRAQLARRAGLDAPEAPHDPEAAPDDAWRPHDLGVADLEIIRNTVPPVTSFALIESALRAAAGRTPAEHRAHLGRLWSGFGDVAATLDWAWDRSAPDATRIVTPTPDNRMIAEPYTRLLASQWNVDQAAALLICSTAAADRFGVAAERRVHPHASAVSNHSVPPPARADLARSPGAAATSAWVLGNTGAGGVGIDDVAHVDLYSCFPAAVQVYAGELALPLDRPERLTVTGGMTFAGGPLNNYVLGALARLVELLRADPGAIGLSSSVSGSLVKQGFGTWSTDPSPHGFHHVDLSAEVAAVDAARPLVDAIGSGTVVACTVTSDPASRELHRVVAIVEGPDGERTIGTVTDAALAAQAQAEELVGASSTVTDDGTLHL